MNKLECELGWEEKSEVDKDGSGFYVLWEKVVIDGEEWASFEILPLRAASTTVEINTCDSDTTKIC